MSVVRWSCGARQVRRWTAALALAGVAIGCAGERRAGQPPPPANRDAEDRGPPPDGHGGVSAAGDDVGSQAADGGTADASPRVVVDGLRTGEIDAECAESSGPGGGCAADVQGGDGGGGDVVVDAGGTAASDVGPGDAQAATERQVDGGEPCIRPAPSRKTHDAVLAALRRRNAAIRNCYTVARQADPTLGSFRVVVRVACLTGRPCQVLAIEDAPAGFEASGGVACIRARAEQAIAAVEPAEDDGAVVVVPFLFQEPGD